MIERDGDRLRLRGAITLADVTRWRAEGLAQIDRDGLVIDLSGVQEADSSALSLLLEWRREARARGFKVCYENMPENMTSLANVYGVLELIPLVGGARAVRMRAAGTDVAIGIEGLAKRYGALQALADVDLGVSAGGFLGPLGPNGAGKTTLINILAGLVHADRGTVRIMGHDVQRDYRAARWGVVPQELAFLSGVFHSVQALPPAWRAATHMNPVFYMIDGFRYGFFGRSDFSPWAALAIVAASFAAISLGPLRMIARSGKLRH